MLTVCKNDRQKIEQSIREKRLDAIVASNSDFIDEIILAMAQEGIIDCLNDSFMDKRKHNAYVPFKCIMALSIAAKMKIKTSLSDIPYAIQDHRTLAELGYNIISHDKKLVFTEGTLRHLLGKYTADELVDYYNDVVQNRISKVRDINPNIHIVDCTKISVNYDNTNYENSSISTDRRGRTIRGYKLATIRGLYKDTGIIEEIRLATAAEHDIAVCEEMLMRTPCFKSGDVLINDRGFISRRLMNYLKNHRGVDTYIPLRKKQTAYELAVSAAKRNNKWQPHPSRKNQLITFVESLGVYWESDNHHNDVPINACVVWDLNDDSYFVFVTTNMKATAKDIIKTYEIRPEIEEDYRQLKDFWKLEDFKSTKFHMIAFHIICVLLGYLFYQLYINSEKGAKYLGKSLPVILKNYDTRFLYRFVLYSGEYFCCMSIKELFELRDSCSDDIKDYLLEFLG